ncbi:MAG: hypothetical protein ACD_70C00016G0003 [uncultured bacterium]|nr:MAG: hypothetical protein ACD_70C00016G0003 [uncultured bacterium]OGT26318.1 MAG: ATPase [Gammaproteobacteria bacterium RIFCSPHIGHO2_02_FULL_42_43]OGT52775.1 MAG: ATPase [Gammaproteobacteria bacterium RIFCSPHIGHO2_12_FULL_41_25]OGT63310.1 MAG: ATPase [Gammaproteobacteria bacterium RIFCSPLOWO2_02_FULL_42_14]OGT86898.1 MAG: ATPase [Gammaproteobacteria bacterium RIFCSPLOWO2_12_FULL_42_18]
MINTVTKHNQFHENGLKYFQQSDPHLRALSELAYQYGPTWWHDLSLKSPGIYILTGGRQIGKSTSCKLLIAHCLQKKLFEPKNILYLPCDEIFDAKELSSTIRFFLASTNDEKFLLIIDEVTFVKDWERVIKALADEGYFRHGLCILTGSDTLILKEAAMSFPGRRGNADPVDFHIYPLTFYEYVDLVYGKKSPNKQQLSDYFNDYLQCGGYLRAINDYAAHKKILPSTFLTYEQWIRGDFLKHAKREDVLLLLLQALFSIGVSQASYSTITQKMGLVSKDTVIDYCELLGRMDVLFYLQAFDQNKKLGFPKKDRKFHFIDPFIYRTLHNWLLKEGYLNAIESESIIAEACVASHCYRLGRTFYFKGQGEIDVIWLHDKKIKAIEVKWANQIRSNDLKTLKHFENSIILCKGIREGIEHDVTVMPISQFLYEQRLT